MDSVKQKPITSKTGSKNFMKELQTRKFPDARSILLEMNGRDVTKEFFQEHGFRTPILVKEPGELGIKIPPVTDLNVILKYLVPDLKEVDVIDVENQDTFKMSVVEYFKYIMSPEKTRILNLISMEVSKTRLSEFIEPPKVVRDIDWVHCYWNRSKEGHKTYVPSATEKYCLISPSNSFTDFHVDFSGTSVWYHIVTGVKDFFLIKPSAVNNHLFWKWSSSYHKEAQFFGDQVDECYKLRIEAGQTLLLPTGWIHAVYTPVDSLVYGGNFLNTYNVQEQFSVYDMELKEKVVEKYVYPHFRELNWFAAEGLCKEIDDLLQKTDILSVPYHLISAIKVASPFLKGWSTKLSVQEKSFYNSDQLFKDMNRILRLYERAVAVRNTEKRESTRVKKRPHSDDFILYDDFKFNKVKRAIKAERTEQMDLDRPCETDLGFHSQETEEDSSSEAWKVKTDATKLSVIIKRCPPSSDSPRRKSRDTSKLKIFLKRVPPSSSDPPNKRSDTPTSSSVFRPSVVRPRDIRPVVTPEPPKKSDLPTYGKSPLYRISRSPVRSLPKYKAVVLEPKSSHSSPTIRIKSVRNWSSLEAQATHQIISSSPADSVICSPLSSQPPTSEDSLGRAVHQDDEYIYPGLDFSDDEEHFGQNSTTSDDKAWAPSGKSLAITPKSDRPQRVGKTKIAVEKGLEAAAAKPSSNLGKPALFPPRKFIPLPKKVKVRPPKPSSSSAPPSAPALKDKHKSVAPTKKGGTTAKQRLGKILKLHKMRR